MSQVSFQMDFEIPAELINVYAQLTAAPFIGYDKPLTDAQSLTALKRYARTRQYGRFIRQGIMKIYYGDVLVGMAFPREIADREYRGFQLKYDTGIWYRLGTIFIVPEHRGKGIASEVIKQYTKTYPNLVWMCEAENIVSQKAAVNGGLKHAFNIHFKSNDQWSFEQDKEFRYTHCVFKSGE